MVEKSSKMGGLVCQWCNSDQLEVLAEHVHLMNAQVSMEHTIGCCAACGKYTAVALWGKDARFAYRTLEYKRRFRSSNWVAVYPVQCATCGSPRTEPAEINVTVANPVSQRFRYDLYVCADCQAATAISYLGQVSAHRAERDSTYRSLWYLDPEADE
jgi:hypothetical protein